MPFLVALTVAVRLPAFFASRHLSYDDGVYGVSVVDMRHGLAPYTGVFSAQGPLHFPLLYVGDLIGLRTLNGPRVTPMLAGIVATIAVWAIGRRIAGARAGFIAGLLVATSGSMIWTTGQVTGDGPASALAVCAVWAALAYRDDPRLRRALLAGAGDGRRTRGEATPVAAVLPVGWWLWSRRRVDHLAAAIGAAVVVWFASAVPWGLGNVWRQSVTYNRGAGPRYGNLDQLGKLSSTLASRDLLVVAALVFALITVVVVSRKLDADRADVAVLAVWAVATALVLVLEPALYRNHLAAIVPPLALLAGVLVRTPRALVVVLVLLVPWSALQPPLDPRAFGLPRRRVRTHGAVASTPVGCAGDQRRTRLRLSLGPPHAEVDERHLGQAHRPGSPHDRIGREGGGRSTRLRGRGLDVAVRPRSSRPTGRAVTGPDSSPTTDTPTIAACGCARPVRIDASYTSSPLSAPACRSGGGSAPGRSPR